MGVFVFTILIVLGDKLFADKIADFFPRREGAALVYDQYKVRSKIYVGTANNAHIRKFYRVFEIDVLGPQIVRSARSNSDKTCV